MSVIPPPPKTITLTAPGNMLTGIYPHDLRRLLTRHGLIPSGHVRPDDGGRPDPFEWWTVPEMQGVFPMLVGVPHSRDWADWWDAVMRVIHGCANIADISDLEVLEEIRREVPE